MSRITKLSIIAFTAASLSACGVAKTTGKVATMPFKAAYKTGELAAKGTYYTGLGAYKTTKFAGKTVYQIGSVPVTITDRALSTTSQVLTITTQAVDIAGKTAVYTKQIQAANLEAELAKYKRAKNVLSVFVDIAG